MDCSPEPMLFLRTMCKSSIVQAHGIEVDVDCIYGFCRQKKFCRYCSFHRWLSKQGHIVKVIVGTPHCQSWWFGCHYYMHISRTQYRRNVQRRKDVGKGEDEGAAIAQSAPLSVGIWNSALLKAGRVSNSWNGPTIEHRNCLPTRSRCPFPWCQITRVGGYCRQ